MDRSAQVLQSQADSIHKHAVRSVPIAWYGVASEVLLMGSFDGWTHGATLSAEDIGDSVFTRFQTDLQLLPVRPVSCCASSASLCWWKERVNIFTTCLDAAFCHLVLLVDAFQYPDRLPRCPQACN